MANGFIVTTALKKIAKLKKRIWVIQGGQGASKTFSILAILINHALTNPDKKIIVCSSELTKMKLTVIADFLKIMKMFNVYDERNYNKSSCTYSFENGSIIQFIPLDKDEVGKGLRCDVLFCNEANKCKFNAFREISTRANRIIIDYNPNLHCWIQDEILTRNDVDFLKLTYLDNEALGDAERKEIEAYKEKAFNDDGTVKNEYWANIYKVYALGELGSVSGTIFTDIVTDDFDETLPYVYGLDFGVRDKDACIKVAVDDSSKKVYLKEMLYVSGESTQQLIDNLKRFTENKTVVCDNASPRSITDLVNAGINARKCYKSTIIDRIKKLQNYKLIVNQDSTNLLYELSNYVWLDKNGETPSEKDNHLIDAMFYAFNFLTYQFEPDEIILY